MRLYQGIDRSQPDNKWCLNDNDAFLTLPRMLSKRHQIVVNLSMDVVNLKSIDVEIIIGKLTTDVINLITDIVNLTTNFIKIPPRKRLKDDTTRCQFELERD